LLNLLKCLVIKKGTREMKEVKMLLMSIILLMPMAFVIAVFVHMDREIPQPAAQAQPPSERAPEWIVNERGQRCIRQQTGADTVVTCG